MEEALRRSPAQCEAQVGCLDLPRRPLHPLRRGLSQAGSGQGVVPARSHALLGDRRGQSRDGP